MTDGQKLYELVTRSMETKKATKTVKSPFGWSKSVRAVGKCSAMDSTGGSISSGGGGGSVGESSSRLEDSALLISPPNQVMVLFDETPLWTSIMKLECRPPSRRLPHDLTS